jgi:heptosyltransferase-2
VRTFAGARSTRVIRKRIIARFFLVNFKWNFYGNDRQSVAGRYIETGRTLGLADDDTGLEIFLPDEVVDRTAGLLKRLNLDRFRCVVGFAPGARHFTKRWPQERFVRLGGELSKNLNAKMLVFGDRSEEEYCGDIVQMINRDAGSAAAESLAGKLSILETAAAFDACNVIVSNDTGLMHLAAARKRKIVAIFGSTVGQFGFFPSYTENIVVERHGLPCRPCNHVGLDRCPKGHFRCMKDIEAAQVAEAVARILGETKG